MIVEVRCPKCKRLLCRNLDGKMEVVCRCGHFKKFDSANACYNQVVRSVSARSLVV